VPPPILELDEWPPCSLGLDLHQVTSLPPLDALGTSKLLSPELAQGEEIFSGASTLPRGHISSSPGCTEDFAIYSCLDSLEVRRTFSGASTLPGGHISSSPGCTEDFAICSCLDSLKARRTFSGASTLPRGHISSSPGCTEDFATCSCLDSLKARRTFSGASTFPRGHISSSPGCTEDFAICSFLDSLKARRTFSLLAYTRSRRGGPFKSFLAGRRRELKTLYLCLQSPGGDEGLKNFKL